MFKKANLTNISSFIKKQSQTKFNPVAMAHQAAKEKDFNRVSYLINKNPKEFDLSLRRDLIEEVNE